MADKETEDAYVAYQVAMLVRQLDENDWTGFADRLVCHGSCKGEECVIELLKQRVLDYKKVADEHKAGPRLTCWGE